MTTAATALIAGGALAAQPQPKIKPGRHCFGSQSVIQDNLPLGASASDTEIVKIEILLVKAQHANAGWLYSTRNGRHFIQVGSPALVAEALRDVHVDQAAKEFAKSTESAYYPLTSDIFTRLSADSDAIGLYSCKGAGQ